MKKKLLILITLGIIVVAGIIILVVWYLSPKTFLNDIEPDKVKSISVFDGDTGQSFIIKDRQEINNIVENIQGIETKRDKLSVGYSGYTFRLSFYDKDGMEIDSFIINSSDTIRSDPFFYHCDGNLCFEYLQELEDRYAE